MQALKPDQETSDDGQPITEKQITLTEEAEQLLESAEDSDSTAKQQAYRAQAARLYLEAGYIQQAKEQRDILQDQLTEITSTTDTGSGTSNDTFIFTPSGTASDVDSDIASDTDKATLEATVALLSTEIALAEQNLLLASELIAEIKPKTRNQQVQLYAAKADFDYLSGNYMSAIERRVQLDPFIFDLKAKSQNKQKIWAALSNIPTSQLTSQRSNNAITSGWLDLAKVMRSGQQNIAQLEDDLLDWGTRHPTHPVGHTFLTGLIEDYQIDTSGIKRIAVILPMNGNLAKVSDAIKNGFLSAYYSDSDSPIKPTITFYDDSNPDSTFEQVYQQAILDGATNIIGPLNKSTINQLSQQEELRLPVLTLNYSADDYSYTDNLFQFGLSPTDEARQVAELAIRENKMRAAVFYPDSKWGNRLKTAFTEHYEALGGRVLSSADYTTNSNDYRRPVKAMLNLNLSSIRRRKVEHIISATTKYEPYRRQDIDMIFLAATHRSARGIMPAFRFHHAGDIPVYATSHVYTGKINRELDRDLNGLIFCDLPWVLQNSSALLKTFNTNWPQQKSLTRLFALGIDAYHLIYNLDYLKNKDYAFYAGQTGNIQLTSANRITRKLLWAKFQKGKPVKFETAISIPEDNFKNELLLKTSLNTRHQRTYQHTHQ